MKPLLLVFVAFGFAHVQQPECEVVSSCGGGGNPSTYNRSIMDAQNTETLGSYS